MPSFWLALLLILLFAVELGWLPAGGVQSVGVDRFGDRVAHLVLPVLTLTVLTAGGLLRFTRAAMIEALRQDYVRTARAKGLGPYGVVVGHALRNAMIPVVTVLALNFGALFSGALIVETMFAYLGMGKLIYDRSWATTSTSRWSGFCSRRCSRWRAISGRTWCTPGWTRGSPMTAEALGQLAATARMPAQPGVSPGRLLLRRFLRHRLAMVSGIVLLLLALCSLAAPLLAAWLGQDPNAVDLLGRFAPPSANHPLGTDEIGRDLLLRLLYGGQVSLFVGLVGAVTAALLGTVIGLIAGYVGGRTDGLLMRLTDAVIALPLLPLLIVLAAVDLGKLGVPAAVAQSEERQSVPHSADRRAGRLDHGRPPGARRHAVGTRTRLRARRRRARRPAAADHDAPHPAQRGLADHRGDDAVGRPRHPDRVDSELPWARHPAAAAQLG